MFIYFLLGLPVLLVGMIAVVGRLEKRMVWPYGPPQEHPPFPDASGYAIRWANEALKAGFTFLGWAPDLKGPRYQISYAFLTSPERDCFVIIGVGTIMAMPLRGTWIYTCTADGRAFYTTDNQSCIEIDVSRRWQSQLARASTFSELLQHHRSLLLDSRVSVQRFTPGREIEEFKRVREEHYRWMSRQGLIAFTDNAAARWRYTWWGSLKVAALNYSIGMLRAVTFGRIPRRA
ncbi:MAG: hypothetical protein IT365_24000 [Candidatus Hydrogenedentes bacterium]|nr:hypothetical protein [Candidatus Hydrogenedentota bacterium]